MARPREALVRDGHLPAGAAAAAAANDRNSSSSGGGSGGGSSGGLQQQVVLTLNSQSTSSTSPSTAAACLTTATSWPLKSAARAQAGEQDTAREGRRAAQEAAQAVQAAQAGRHRCGQQRSSSSLPRRACAAPAAPSQPSTHLGRKSPRFCTSRLAPSLLCTLSASPQQQLQPACRWWVLAAAPPQLAARRPRARVPARAGRWRCHAAPLRAAVLCTATASQL